LRKIVKARVRAIGLYAANAKDIVSTEKKLGSVARADAPLVVEDLKTMPGLIPEEIPLAQQIAYQKSVARGNGQDPPPYNPEATVGDFWQAAGEVIALRGRPDSLTNWQTIYGTQNVVRGRIVEEVRTRLEARGTGPRSQVPDNFVFEPLATASAIAIGRKDYGFAISLFHEGFAIAREFEENNRCETHKGAMAFNVAVAYLRANDFAAAMHYFQLAQIETQQTTSDMGWWIYESHLFQQNFWQILDLYEQQNPLPLYNTFWGVPFGSAAAKHDWTHLTDHSKLLYIIVNAERISFRRLSAQPHMAVSESFGLSYWNLIADLTRLLETEIRNRGIAGQGLQAQVLHHILNSPIAGFHGIVQGPGSLSAHHLVNSPVRFNAHFAAIRNIITNATETREKRIAAAAYLAGVARNQVQHQVETTMVIFHDRAAAIFTAQVLLCLCRLDAWAA